MTIYDLNYAEDHTKLYDLVLEWTVLYDCMIYNILFKHVPN